MVPCMDFCFFYSTMLISTFECHLFAYFHNCVLVYPCSDFMWTMFLLEKWLEQNLWEGISLLSQWLCMQQYGMHLIGLPMEANTGLTTSMHPMLLNSLTLSCTVVQWIQLSSTWPRVTMLKALRQQFLLLVLHQHKESKWRISGRSTWHTPTAMTKSDTKSLLRSVSSVPKKLRGWGGSIPSHLEAAAVTMENDTVAAEEARQKPLLHFKRVPFILDLVSLPGVYIFIFPFNFGV